MMSAAWRRWALRRLALTASLTYGRLADDVRWQIPTVAAPASVAEVRASAEASAAVAANTAISRTSRRLTLCPPFVRRSSRPVYETDAQAVSGEAALTAELELVPARHGRELEQRPAAVWVAVAEVGRLVVPGDLQQALLDPVVEPSAPEDELAQPVDERLPSTSEIRSQWRTT